MSVLRNSSKWTGHTRSGRVGTDREVEAKRSRGGESRKNPRWTS